MTEEKVYHEVRFAQWADYVTVSFEFVDKTDKDGNNLDASFKKKQPLDGKLVKKLNFYDYKQASEGFMGKLKGLLLEFKAVKEFRIYKNLKKPFLQDFLSLDTFKRITLLELIESVISDADVVPLKPKKLDVLRLIKSTITAGFLRELFNGPSELSSSVKVLGIEALKIEGPADAIFADWTALPKLEEASFEKGDMPDNVMDGWLAMLVRATQLKKVILSKNNLTFEQCKLVADLMRNKKVEVLELVSCGLTDQKVAPIISAIKFAPRLKEIKLSDSVFTNMRDPILAAIKGHVSLNKVDMGNYEADLISRMLIDSHCHSTVMKVVMCSAINTSVGKRSPMRCLNSDIIRRVFETLGSDL